MAVKLKAFVTGCVLIKVHVSRLKSTVRKIENRRILTFVG